MKKFILTIMVILGTFLLASCESKNVFDFVIDKKYDEYLNMGTTADYPPYEYLTTSGTKVSVDGIDIWLGKEIAKKVGKNLKVINKGFDYLLDDLKNGKLDIVISGMNPTSDRKEQVDFSNIYYEATHTLVVHKDNLNMYEKIEDLNKANFKIGAQLGTTQAELIDSTFNLSQKILLASVNDLVMQLLDKKLNAVLLETPVALSLQKANDKLALTDFVLNSVSDDEPSGSAVAVQKGQHELLTTINTLIDELVISGQMETIIIQYMTKDVVEGNKLFSTKNLLLLLEGLVLTIILALLGTIFGSVIGLLITLLRISNNKVLKTISKVYVEVIRGTPLLVQVLLIYSFFNIPVILFLGIDISSFIPGVLALVINSSAYVSEIFRGGIESVDVGQKEAGLSLGMTNKRVMRKIILPQAIKNIIPSLGNEFISLIKETSIFMYLGVAELMYNANIIKAETYQIKQVYLLTALLYLVLTLSTSKILSVTQKKLGEKYEK